MCVDKVVPETCASPNPLGYEFIPCATKSKLALARLAFTLREKRWSRYWGPWDSTEELLQQRKGKRIYTFINQLPGNPTAHSRYLYSIT